MTRDEIDFVESQRNGDTKKITIKKLHSIYQSELGLPRERRCFCSESERVEFRTTFYAWYENYNHYDE